MAPADRPVAPADRPIRSGVPGELAVALIAVALIAAACGNSETPGGVSPPPTSAVAEPAAGESPEPADPPEPDPAARPEPGDTESAGEGAEGDGTDRPDKSGSAAGGEPRGPVAPKAPVGLDPAAARLKSLLGELGTVAAGWNPTGRAAVAVVTADGTLYGLNEHRPHVSASAVKPVWAAAAIASAGVDAVAPLAHPALVQSDNLAAGRIIDLVGIDAVNAWATDVAGLTGTHLAAWQYGADRVAQSVLDGGTRANLTTVADLALFYARLRRGELLPTGAAAALESWLRATDRGSAGPGSVNGALLARLPEQVAAEAAHKAGWLPPYCCVAEVRLVIDAGVVPLPDGGWFAIAALGDRGEAYNLSIRWVALAACRVYVLLAGDETHDCERAGDGVPRPGLWPPPPEPEPTGDDTEDIPRGSEAGNTEQGNGPADEAQPVEDQPAETQPAETPAEDQPAETQPAETPAEDQPAETQPAEAPAGDGSGG